MSCFGNMGAREEWPKWTALLDRARRSPAAEALRVAMDRAIAAKLAEVAANREKLVTAFIAETGLLPSECELVEEHRGFDMRRVYVRRRLQPHSLDEADRP